MSRLRGMRIGLILSLGSGLLALVASGCSQSPTAPDPVRSPGGGFTVVGEAVIDGQVTTGGSSGGTSAEVFIVPSADPANIKVVVVGTGISAVTDSKGSFRLINVPGGNVQLAFERSDINAQVGVPNVDDSQHVTIKVEVAGNSAILLEDDREPLQEFEGKVVGLDTVQQILTLDDSTQVQVDNEDTWFDGSSDVPDFDGLAAAFNAGDSVEVQGKAMVGDGGLLLATAILVEIEDEAQEFDGEVIGVTRDPDTLTVQYDGGTTLICVDAATVWSPGSVFDDLDSLADAFDLGNVIKVEGTAVTDASCPGGALATQIEAEVEETKFKGFAEAVDLTASTVTLDEGTVVMVNDDTVWKTSGKSGGSGLGNIDSLEEIQIQLDQGNDVEIEGEGYVFDIDGTILALEIRAKAENGDGDGVVPDFSDQIEDLEDLIEMTEQVAADNGLNGGQLNSLVSKLENAIKSLEKGNATPAINKIEAYINEVEAFAKNDRIDDEDAEALIEKAEEIIADIEAVAAS